MNEMNSPLTTPPLPNSASPPPKCAICLGTFTNKCFSDSCMHQFCFTCLLEWSKVKPECPLCKQPFKTIIHNIKSNDEYDEHIITPNVRERTGFIDNDNNFMYLRAAATPSRHFQFRTTFTVDPGGELAIQQMLLSHPLTNSLYNMQGGNFYSAPTASSSRFGRLRQTRRASSSTSFRRSIYTLNLWVYYESSSLFEPPREVNPSFFRDNPAARNRLVPWLNRELNALLHENTQQIMQLVDVIMDHLPRWHIRSVAFKNLLVPYLSNKTNHFVHEFFNFMKSPFDMIAYDRHIIYTDRPQSPTYLVSDIEDDSDVMIVNISEPVTINNNPFQRPTIEVIEINSDSSHDSDVIIGETPAPEIVNLVDTDSDDAILTNPTRNTTTNDDSEGNRSPILPLKVRLKRKRQSREKRPHKKVCTKRHWSCSRRSSSSSLSSFSSSHSSSFSSSLSSTSSNSDSTNSSDTVRAVSSLRLKRKHKYMKLKSRMHRKGKSNDKEKYKRKVKTPLFSKQSNSTDPDTSNNLMFDSDDNLPLSKFKCQEQLSKKDEGPERLGASTSKTHTVTSKIPSNTNVTCATSQYGTDCNPSCSMWNSSSSSMKGYQDDTLPYSGINTSTSNSNLPSIRNEYMNMPYSMPNFGYDDYNSNVSSAQNVSVKQCCTSNALYNNLQQFGVRYNALAEIPHIGNRYYDGPSYDVQRNLESYTPPLPTPSTSNTFNERNDEYYGSSHRNYHNYPWKMESPSHVTVDVGTSPIKTEITKSEYSYCTVPPKPEYSYCTTASSSGSGSRRLQSVIVKKENPNLGFFVCSDSSDN